MSGRRSSAKGRGAEVLSGQAQAVRLDRRGSEPEPAEPQPPASQPLPSEPMTEGQRSSQPESTVSAAADQERALYEEARAAESGPDQEDSVWAVQASSSPIREAGSVPSVQAVVGKAPRALAQVPIPALEETMEQKSPSGGLLPPVPGSTILSTAADEAAVPDIQSPEEAVEPLELPERPLAEERRQQVVEAASGRFGELDQQISKIYDQVLNQVGENQDIATACYNLLLKARDIVLRQEVGQLAQAEYYVEQARARLKRASVSRTGARRNAWWITIWGFIWAVAYVAALILLDSEWVQEIISLLRIESTYVDPKVFFSAMVWGGIGGVVAIWYSLFKHVSGRDFDSHYNITYVGKPFFGLILGATVYMIIHLAIVSLGIWPTSSAGDVSEAISPSLAPWIIYLLAWAGGFKENRIFGVVDLVMKRVFSSQESTSSTL